MIKRKATARKSTKKSTKLNRFVLLVPIIIAFLIGSWFLISPQIFAPSGINEIGSTTTVSTDGSTVSKQLIYGDPSGSPLPAGCYYKQVQCAAAPCPPIVTCASPSPTSTTVPSNSTCRLAYPSCPRPRCFADGTCEKVACEPVMICDTPTATPVSSPVPTCIPHPTCPAGQVCPTYKLDYRYCGVRPTPSPTQTPVPTCRPQPDCPAGRMCAMMVTREYCQIVKPTPTTQTGTIAAFSAGNPCGSDSFQDYGYSCKNGIRNNISGCQSIQTAMTIALKACSGIKGL